MFVVVTLKTIKNDHMTTSSLQMETRGLFVVYSLKLHYLSALYIIKKKLHKPNHKGINATAVTLQQLQF